MRGVLDQEAHELVGGFGLLCKTVLYVCDILVEIPVFRGQPRDNLSYDYIDESFIHAKHPAM
ncbi:Uncharacterised protein [Mycobacteroides abscessus subsp. abscessus]|nr:Uncharacterised protein [Mycobacteroides abscessus subsp. abscessus]